MSDERQFIVVIESGLSDGASGAKITTTEPLGERAGLEILESIMRGETTEVYSPYKRGRTVRVNDRQLLDISAPRILPAQQSRITLAEMVSERS